MADNLCALLFDLNNHLKSESWQPSPYREYLIPPADDALVDGVMLVLKNRCERLGLGELFGVSDESLIEHAYAVPAFYKRGELTGRPIHPAGLRLPLILDRCETLIPQSGEVCPLWEKPFPSCPINTIETVAEFLKLSKEVWFRDWQGKRDTDSDHNLDRARRDLHNVRMTLTWLHDLGRGALPPEWNDEPTTARDCELMADNLLRWIEAMRTAPNSTETPPRVKIAPQRMDKGLADLIARQLDKGDPKFKHGDAETWAKRIRERQNQLTGLMWSCSAATVHATDFWDETMLALGRGRKSRSVPTVAYSEKTAATVANGDSVLSELVAKEEQLAIDAVMQSGMKDGSKAATVEKIKAGEMTPAQAIELSKTFPMRRKRDKELIRE